MHVAGRKSSHMGGMGAGGDRNHSAWRPWRDFGAGGRGMLITWRQKAAEEEEEREEVQAPYLWYQQDFPPSSPTAADSPTAELFRGKGIRRLQPEPEYCDTTSRLKVVGGGWGGLSSPTSSQKKKKPRYWWLHNNDQRRSN